MKLFWEALFSLDDSGSEILRWSSLETQKYSWFHGRFHSQKSRNSAFQRVCILETGIWVMLCAYRGGHIRFLCLQFFVAKIHVIPNTYFTESYNLVKNNWTIVLFIYLKKIWRTKGVEKEILSVTWSAGRRKRQFQHDLEHYFLYLLKKKSYQMTKEVITFANCDCW